MDTIQEIQNENQRRKDRARIRGQKGIAGWNDMKYVPAIVAFWKAHPEIEIKAKDLAERIGFPSWGSAGPSRLRSLMRYIRINDLVPFLLASQNGYRLAKTEAEVEANVRSLQQKDRRYERDEGRTRAPTPGKASHLVSRLISLCTRLQLGGGRWITDGCCSSGRTRSCGAT